MKKVQWLVRVMLPNDWVGLDTMEEAMCEARARGEPRIYRSEGKRLKFFYVPRDNDKYWDRFL